MKTFATLQSAAASLVSLLFTAAGEKNIDAEKLFKEGERLFVTEAVDTSGFDKALALYAVGRYLEVTLAAEKALPEARQIAPFQTLLEAAQWRLSEMSDTARGTSAPGFLFFGRTARRDDLDAVLAVQGFMQERSDETIDEVRALRKQVAYLTSVIERRHAEVDARNAAKRAARV
jgi:hypothetical protein